MIVNHQVALNGIEQLFFIGPSADFVLPITLMSWVDQYVPAFEKRWNPLAKNTNSS